LTEPPTLGRCPPPPRAARHRFVWYAHAESFADCLIGEFDAIGTTLATGSLEAWAVDRVRAEGGRAGDRLFARAQIVSRAAMIAGGIACGYLAEIGLALTWYVAAAGFALTGVLAALTMDEPRPDRHTAWAGVRLSVGRTVLDGVRAVRAAPVLVLLCLLTGTIAFGGFPLHMLWQTHVQALSGESYRLVGWLVALLNLASLAGSAVLPRVLARLGRPAVLAAASLWRGAMLALLASATRLGPAMTGLVDQEVSSGFTDPLLSAWTNEHVAPERRATVLSVRVDVFHLRWGRGAGVHRARRAEPRARGGIRRLGHGVRGDGDGLRAVARATPSTATGEVVPALGLGAPGGAGKAA
jgi:hypothetical protein